ncbi:MAG: DUF4382 domain-containing protein [Gammaproteobacteria bacterium]|nr:DUF4382 domain-containing protein [Gammaproteobacteria bacterium]
MKFCHPIKLQIWGILILGLILGLGLVGCGETTDKAAPSGTTSPAPTTASVALLLTDAPTDEFAQINLTISRVELLAVDGSNVPLFEGLRTIDLLSLRNTADLFAANNAVPPGVYEKIRMHLEDVELVKVDDDGEVERIHPRLLANGKLDLNPRKSFVLAPGKALVIQVDVDAKKSIHIVGHDRDEQGHHEADKNSGDDKDSKSNKKNDKKPDSEHAADKSNDSQKEDKSHREHDDYRFRPVVFIDIIDMISTINQPVGKVVRIEGDVTKVDVARQQVEVCNIQDVAANCITMQVNAKTGLYFNNPTAAYGSGLGTLALSEVTKLERGIGFGRVRMMNGVTWLDTEAIEFGPKGAFWHAMGDVVAAPDASTHIFYFGIHAAQTYIAGSVFRIVPVASAKLFSRDGVQLDWSAMLVGQVVEVEGVLVRTKVNYTIETGVIYLDINADNNGMLNGALTHLSTAGFNVSTSAGDYCVVPAATVNVFSVITAPDGSLSGSRESLSILQAGQRLDLYGVMGSDGCYHASDILVYLQ